MRARVVACVLAIALPANAQSGSQVVAQSLFEEARSLMEQGRYVEACPKLEESQRLDPGGGTLLNLAACHEKIGKTATAWAEYNEAVGVARRDGRRDREAEANQRISELEQRLSKIRIEVDAANPPELMLFLDGKPLARAVWDSLIPLDPGEHRIDASAPNRRQLSLRITLAPERGSEVVRIPVLEEIALAPRAPPPAATTPAPVEKPKGSSFKSPPLPAVVLLGAGALGFGAGTYFALKASKEKRDSDALCESEVCPSSQTRAVELNDRARRDAWFANAGFGVGVIATAIGIYLWVDADSPRVDAAVSGDGGRLRLRGTF